MKGLVLNLGFKSIRAIIFSSEGKILASSSRSVQTFLSDVFVEQDPNEWWSKGVECIREVLTSIPEADFITVTASAACVIPVDPQGRPLAKTILVSDKRATREASDISQLESFRKLSYEAGAYYTLPRILWIKRNLPEVYEKTWKFLSPNDYFIARMSGDFFIDELNATKYYTVENRYPLDLLGEIEIDEKKLPEIKPIGFRIQTSNSFEQESHLSKRTSIVITTYDAICAFFGSGVQREGDAADISGTVTSLRVLTRKNMRPGESRIFELKYNNWNITGGSNNLGGGLIEWLLSNFYQGYKHTDLEQLSERFAAKTGLLFLPYLLGERAPLWDDQVRGGFLGVERFHTQHDMARAVLESTGFVLRSLIETIEENEIPITRLFSSGGLARIDLVNQIKADVTGKRVHRLAESESTALGAYCLAQKAFEPEFDSTRFFKIEKVYEPDYTKHQIYSEYYELFKKAYTNLKSFHQERIKILDITDIKAVNL